MMFSILTLAMVGTAAAHNSLLSFVSNRMRENSDFTLIASEEKACTYEELAKATSNTLAGIYFSCIKDDKTWTCNPTVDSDGFLCMTGNRYTGYETYFIHNHQSLAPGKLVTARSKGAVVTVSSEASYNGENWPGSEGYLNSPRCWVGDNASPETYIQYSFDTTVTVVAVDT